MWISHLEAWYRSRFFISKDFVILPGFSYTAPRKKKKKKKKKMSNMASVRSAHGVHTASWKPSIPQSVGDSNTKCVINTLHAFSVVDSNTSVRGVLTLTWYTCMCLPFGALFREICYSDYIGGFHQRRKSPNYINWVYLTTISPSAAPVDINIYHGVSSIPPSAVDSSVSLSTIPQSAVR